MGNYAAEIRVNTKIETKQANSQLLSLENRMLKASDKVEVLNGELEKLKNAKAPTKEYVAMEGKIADAKYMLEAFEKEYERLSKMGIGIDIDKDILRAYKRISELKAELDRTVEERDADAYLAAEDRLNRAKSVLEDLMSKEVRPLGDIIYYESLKQKIGETKSRITEINNVMQKLVESGKAFHVGTNQEEIKQKSKELVYAQNDLEALQQKHSEVMEKMDASEKKLERKSAFTFKRIAETAKRALGGAASLTQSAFTKTASAIRKAGDTAKKVFRKMHGDTKKQNSLLATLKSRFSGIALSLLVFNWVTRGFNAVVASVKDGVKNLAQYSGEYNAVVSDMVSALATLKNSFATAFAPIMTVALPYLTQLINVLTTAVNKVAQFIAALTGKSTWTKAKKQTTDYAGSLNEVAKEAKEAYRSVAAFDELNVLNRQEETAGAGAGGMDPSSMFEEVPIDSKIQEFADKLKAVLTKLFEPLKKAWERQGKKVMDAWKYALKEVSKLVKSIGNDFLEVWTQEATVAIFEDILLILADIGLVIGNLAKRFREAWEENETGKKILENIRDLFGIIVKNIKEAADFTVDWSDKLDFSPLLETFEEFTKSLAGPVDFISGMLSDFYKQVLLPLSQWTIEKGLPEFLSILADFNNKVDWDGLRQRLSEFWEHLEPFAETIGEGLLIFIRGLSDRLAEFTSSETFESFLTKLEDWMDNVEPEDVAKAIERIAEVLIGLKLALLGFEAVKGVTAVFSVIKTFLSFFGKNGEAATVIGGMDKTVLALGRFESGLRGLGALVFLLEGFKVSNFNREVSDLISSMPKEEDYKNIDEYNKAVANFKSKTEELTNTRYDTSAIDELISKISGKELERDENGAIKCGLTDLLNGIMKKIDEAYPKLEESQKAFSDAGYNSVTGFNNGFQDAESETEKVIDKFCDETITSRTKKKLEINSPSKLFERIGNFLMQGLVNGIDGMRDGLSTALNNVYDTVTSILEKIKSYVSSMVDSIKSKISSITSGVSSAWNSVTSKVSGAFGRSAAPAAYSYDMPKLATGGITTGTTIAKIGEAGREAVLPLENNTGWMDTLADKINGSGTVTIVAELDGREIFRNVVARSEIYYETTGKSAFAY